MCPQAGAAQRQNAARCQDFTSGNILPSLCQTVTACALVLYFDRGGNLSKNMYSELLNSTSATEAHLILQTNTPYLGSTQRPVSSSAFYLSTARVLKEGEINKPDLIPPGSEEPVEDTGCVTRGGKRRLPAAAGSSSAARHSILVRMAAGGFDPP
ncbi:small integral membrane protein 32 isoform X3 [Gallus gallus]|uniref:small integral membrane protein 32 isoform X3 n=1 Tax=Gallus gallus TaxID=9031 RepID=UPI00035042AD|nr:small integral membrane protein 32 isoform X3 [Gallus gallus]XP_046756436.1 small integral membrane protein 32 isoform X3 [Gallus gallus]XP_046783158.1 small integral membrane protein 32 isoform X3 [Gallus gallus]XP_046783159.1 small integral membrane protein 32 isoform X3 [Gallus gallus]